MNLEEGWAVPALLVGDAHLKGGKGLLFQGW